MRPRAAHLATSASLALALNAGRAHATNCSGIISPCVNDDTLWPHAGPARFVAIGASETVASGQMGFGLVTSYLSRPIVLGLVSPGGPGTDEFAVNDQVNGTFLWSYGVTNRLELDLALPLSFGQGGTGLRPVTGGDGLKDTSVRDMRFGFALALVPHARIAPDPPPGSRYGQGGSFGLVGRFEVSAPTGDGDQFAGERTGVFVPSLAADARFGPWFAAAEAGARLRPTAQLLSSRIGTQIVTAMGVGCDILPGEVLSAVLEAWALPTLAAQADVTSAGGTLVSTQNAKHIVPAEWQVSARSAPLRGGDLSIQLGGGGGIPFGSETAITTPRFRITLGVRWAPLARDTDADGVPDAVDRCPIDPAPGTATGCPAGTSDAQAVDLRLTSARDTCTDEPELVDGFKEEDGCPDGDQDKDGIPDRADKCPLVPEDFLGVVDGCPEAK